MRNETFDRGIAILLTTFDNLAATPARLTVWRQLLDNLEDEAFLKAVALFCQTRSELYPGTNIIPEIRRLALPAPLTAEDGWMQVEDFLESRVTWAEMDLVVQRLATALEVGYYKSGHLETPKSVLRAQFLKLFDATQRQIARERLGALTTRERQLVDRLEPSKDEADGQE